MNDPAHGSFFHHLKIGTRIHAGFAVVLALLAVVSVVGLAGLKGMAANVEGASFLNKVSTQALTVDGAVTNLRFKARDYALSGEPNRIVEAREQASVVRGRIDDALQLFRKPERIEAMRALQAAFGQYTTIFEKVVEIKEKEKADIASILNPAGAGMVAAAGRAMDEADRAGDTAFAVRLAGLRPILMQMRLDANRFLAQDQPEFVRQYQASLADARHLLAELPRAPLATVAAEVERYAGAFDAIAAANTMVTSLTDRDLLELGRKMAQLAESIKDNAVTDMNALERASVDSMERNTTIDAALSLGALIGGMLLAWGIARSILIPLAAMTGTMTRLAKGEHSVVVPGLDLRNEIGDMGRAVQVFKDNALRVLALQAEQDAAKVRAEEDKRHALNAMADSFESSVRGVVQNVSSAATQMQATAGGMSATAEETSRQATAVAAASEQASANVQTVASAAEELSASIGEIARQVHESTRIAGTAVEEAGHTNQLVKGLAEAASRIGDVLRLISDIASQTNLLALNATIEAARAGDAGKGFAVVAGEVKNLAGQTAKATDEIAQQILGVQTATKDAVHAIQVIAATIGRISEISTAIASAVEEQGAATKEIARNVQEASAGTQEVSSNISGVTQAAGETGAASSQVLSAAGQLSREAEMLRGEVDRFISRIRAA